MSIVQLEFKKLRRFALLILSFIMVISFSGQSAADPVDIRYPAVAGSFYPEEVNALDTLLTDLLSRAKEKSSQKDQLQSLKALILPHAGYVFSGYTAAIGYEFLEGRPIDTIILIGPYHQAYFPGVSLWTKGVWKTPLGDCQIDESLAKGIQDTNPLFAYSKDIHLKEHSLEVHVPFIQKILPHAKIVPILISDPKYAKELAKGLAKVLEEVGDKKNVVLVASTDMSHYHPAMKAHSLDQYTLKLFEDTFRIQDSSVYKLYKAIKEEKAQLCGAAAVLTIFELSKLMHWNSIEILDYRTSGDKTGDNDSVVGYSASAIVGEEEREDASNLNPQQKQELLNLARRTLESYLSTGNIPSFESKDSAFSEKRAVFVTIKDKQGNLRGCIGRFTPEEPLYKAVIDMSIEAATKDSRFSPVILNDLPNLIFEISILSPIRTVNDANDIVFGKHGVILSQGINKGVFLPEVSETFSNKENFLSELCSQKAGLERSCWKDPATKVDVFTTIHLSE